MSALDFITSGGMAKISGELPEEEREVLKSAIKMFSEKLREKALALQVPASRLTVRQATFLFIGKDTSRYHVIFAESPGSNQIVYRDLSTHGRVELVTLAHQVRIEVGEVAWSFNLPLSPPEGELEILIEKLVSEYIGSVLQAQRTPEKRMSQESAVHPEIASGLERFRTDYTGQRTAFIMMQFTRSDAHSDIVQALKEKLLTHGIVGLRADDKQYMDDQFPNIKVYMHACDIGIGIFERITEDDFNPNLSLEVGYMLGLEKDVLVLKDKTLRALPTDLIGRLYREFDTRNVAETIGEEVEKWLSDKGYIEPI